MVVTNVYIPRPHIKSMAEPEIKKGKKEYVYIECPKCGKTIEGSKESEIKENYSRHKKACKDKK